MDWKAIVPFLIPLLSALAGGGAASLADVTGAKAWQTAEAEKLAEARRLEQRVHDLEAQQTLFFQIIACRQGDQ